MKCTNCGVEVADGMRFCTSCGTPIADPVATDDSDKTVLVSQDMNLDTQPVNNPFGQPMAPQVPPQPNQFTSQPQMGQPMNTQFTGQPQMGQPMNTQFAGQPQMGQPMNTQFTGQPQVNMTQNAPYAGQPQMAQGMNTQYTGQPNMGMTQGMYTGQPYGQPNMMYNQPPKPPKKPLSPKAKKGIIIGAIAAVVAIIFFVVILPLLTRNKLQGEYTCRDSYLAYTIIFDNGSYAIFDEDGDGTEAGTYKLKDDKITMTSLNGVETKATFDAKENEIKLTSYYYSTDKYKSTDEKEKLGIKLTPTYVDDLEEKVATEAEKIANELSLTYSYYYIYEDDLDDPDDDFEEALVEALDYKNDPTLQLLLEEEFVSIDISIYDDEVDVNVYAYY